MYVRLGHHACMVGLTWRRSGPGTMPCMVGLTYTSKFRHPWPHGLQNRQSRGVYHGLRIQQGQKQNAHHAQLASFRAEPLNEAVPQWRVLRTINCSRQRGACVLKWVILPLQDGGRKEPDNMDRWNIALWIGAGYIAVVALMRLMVQKR